MHVSSGPSSVEAVYLRAALDGGTVPVELSGAFAANLGPLHGQRRPARPDGHAVLPGGRRQRSGRPTWRSRFKPPTGVGLAVDAGVVTGGGYL